MSQIKTKNQVPTVISTAGEIFLTWKENRSIKWETSHLHPVPLMSLARGHWDLGRCSI